MPPGGPVSGLFLLLPPFPFPFFPFSVWRGELTYAFTKARKIYSKWATRKAFSPFPPPFPLFPSFFPPQKPDLRYSTPEPLAGDARAVAHRSRACPTPSSSPLFFSFLSFPFLLEMMQASEHSRRHPGVETWCGPSSSDARRSFFPPSLFPFFFRCNFGIRGRVAKVRHVTIVFPWRKSCLLFFLPFPFYPSPPFSPPPRSRESGNIFKKEQ